MAAAIGILYNEEILFKSFSALFSSEFGSSVVIQDDKKEEVCNIDPSDYFISVKHCDDEFFLSIPASTLPALSCQLIKSISHIQLTCMMMKNIFLSIL